MRIVSLLLGLAVLALGACVPAPTMITPSSGYAITGATFRSPDQTGWVGRSVNLGLVQLGAPSEDPGSSLVITVVASAAPSEGSDAAVLQAIAEQRKDVPTGGPITVVSLRERLVTFKGSRCIDTRTRMRVPTVQGPPVPWTINIRNYLCRHPDEPGLVMMFEISERSPRADPSARFRAAAESFYGSVRFMAMTPDSKLP